MSDDNGNTSSLTYAEDCLPKRDLPKNVRFFDFGPEGLKDPKAALAGVTLEEMSQPAVHTVDTSRLRPSRHAAA